MTIWNLSKGEIFFSGEITLYQNHVKDVWKGDYSLDSLDSFVKQFVELNKGKKHSEQDRYILWTNYKEEYPSDKTYIEKMLEDIPDEFLPQRDAPDFFEFAHGKHFTIKNNYVKVYTNTAIIQNDFSSILNAAKTIITSLYFKDTPTDLILVKIILLPESIDVSSIKMNDRPHTAQSIKLTTQEDNAKPFSFNINFDLEIYTAYTIEVANEHNAIVPGAERFYNLDFFLLYIIDAIIHPGKICIDKKNHLYFATPKDSYERDLIYAAKIMECLRHVMRANTYEDSLLYWMEYYANNTEKIEADMKESTHDIAQQKAIRDYIDKYGRDGKISSDMFLEHLKAAIDLSPLDFIEEKNDFIANYAKAVVSGDAT